MVQYCAITEMRRMAGQGRSPSRSLGTCCTRCCRTCCGCGCGCCRQHRWRRCPPLLLLLLLQLPLAAVAVHSWPQVLSQEWVLRRVEQPVWPPVARLVLLISVRHPHAAAHRQRRQEAGAGAGLGSYSVCASRTSGEHPSIVAIPCRAAQHCGNSVVAGRQAAAGMLT